MSQKPNQQKAEVEEQETQVTPETPAEEQAKPETSPASTPSPSAVPDLAGIEAFTQPVNLAQFSLQTVRDERPATDLLQPLAVELNEDTWFRGVGEQSQTLLKGFAKYAVFRKVRVRSNDPESLAKGELFTDMAVVDIVGTRTDDRCSEDTKAAGPVLWSASGLVRLRRSGGTRTQVSLQIRGPGAPSISTERDGGTYNDPHPNVKDQFTALERSINRIMEFNPEFGKAWLDACTVSEPAAEAKSESQPANLGDAIKKAKAAEEGRVTETQEV